TCSHALIIEEPETTELRNRPATAAAKNILQQTWALAETIRVPEPLVRIQSIGAMLPITFPVKILFARFNHQAERAAAFASLRSIVKRRRDFHFLERVRIGQRHSVKVREVEIVNVDALQRHAVVARSLSVNGDVRGTATRAANISRLAGDACR